MSDKPKYITGIVVSLDGVSIHPDTWEDMKDATEGEKEEILSVIRKMQQAAKNTKEKYGKKATAEDFTRELELLGEISHPLGKEDYKLVEELERRLRSMPSKQ